MDLLASELRRLMSRRMLLWMTLALLALVAVVLIANVVNSNPSSAFAGDMMRPADLWLRERHAAELGVAQRNRVVPIAVVSYLLIVAFGASAVGAEYRAGTVTTILTWEPRRVRLLLVRLLAIALVTMLLFLVVLGVFVGGWIGGSAFNGSMEGSDATFWSDLVGVLVRATLLAGVFAVLSASLATLARNTAGAIGIWFGYLVAIEAILQGNVKAVTPGLLLLNVGAVFGGEAVTISGHTLEPGTGALVVAAYLVVAAGGAVLLFARRDVT